MARLDERVCIAFLQGPRRGRAWAETSHRCRTDPAFAREVYAKIATERGRALFKMLYGE
jgi:hypothetical protein